MTSNPEQNNSLTLDKEFYEYCSLNNIQKPNEYAKKIFTDAFNIIKYGTGPITTRNISTPKILQQEVVEKINIPLKKEEENIYGE